MAEYIERAAVLNGVALYMAENAYLNDTALDVLKMVGGWLTDAPAADVVSRAAFDQVMWERDTAMEQLKEHGIPFGGKADVVEVVRCETCKHWKEDYGGEGKCMLRDAAFYYDDFCSYGKRRSDNATD